MSSDSVILTSRLLRRKEELEHVHACAGGGGWGWKEGSGVWGPVGKKGDQGVSRWAGDKRPRGSHRMLD